MLCVVPFGQVTLIQTALGKIAPVKIAPMKLELMMTTLSRASELERPQYQRDQRMSKFIAALP